MVQKLFICLYLVVIRLKHSQICQDQSILLEQVETWDNPRKCSSSSVSRPQRTQEDRAGLEVLKYLESSGTIKILLLQVMSSKDPGDWAVVAQNVCWGCPNLFQVKKPHQDHPSPCPVLQGPRRMGLVLTYLESSGTGQ